MDLHNMCEKNVLVKKYAGGMIKETEPVNESEKIV